MEEKSNFEKKTKRLNWILFSYSVLLLGFGFYSFLTWPISSLDTDLWYHLTGGRYIFTNLSLPQNSFFSFISPAREYIDYYWLFQVLVYQIYDFWQYQGLVIFRALLYLVTLILVAFYLFREGKGFNPNFYNVLVFSLYAMFLVQRTELVRPHSFSYLFIIIFFILFEARRRYFLFLPFVAVLWSNLHGIEFPVMHLILLAFLIEFSFQYVRDPNRNLKNLYRLIPIGLAFLSIYFTPHGLKIFTVPHTPITYDIQYISEFKPITLKGLTAFQLPTTPEAFQAIFNILTALIILAFIRSLIKREIPVSHLVLFGGGLFLLTRGNRFMYEFILLALPLVKAQSWSFSVSSETKGLTWVKATATLLVLLIPLIYLKTYFAFPGRYPFSPRNLPEGVATFLRKIPAQGSIFNHPNRGGYLEWMLYPRYKIFMDMQVPFLFTDSDFFQATRAFNDPEVLRKIILKYKPAFISAYITDKEFKKIIEEFPGYVLVFFDQAEVLYINEASLPEIAKQYKIVYADPYDLISEKLSLVSSGRSFDGLKSELLRMVALYPECLITNQILAMLYNRQGEPEKSLIHAQKLLINYPEYPIGYRIMGDILSLRKQYNTSVDWYQKALKRAEKTSKKEIYRQLGHVYMEIHEYKKAHESLKKGIGIFSGKTSYQDLLDLSSAALAAGKFKEAHALLKFAFKIIPEGDQKAARKLNHHLEYLGIKTEDLL